MTMIGSGVDKITAGTNVTITGTDARPIINASGGGGSGVSVPYLKGAAGYSYSLLSNGVLPVTIAANATLAIDSLRVNRISLKADTTINPVWYAASVVGTNPRLTLGVYAVAADGSIGALVADFGETVLTGAALSRGISLALPKGEYYAASFCSNQISIRGFSATTSPADGPMLTASLNPTGSPLVFQWEATTAFVSNAPATISLSSLTPNTASMRVFTFYEAN